jgi:glyoxylase-like metal-dependent hydrolase (beta-lactamase superfamily II)
MNTAHREIPLDVCRPAPGVSRFTVPLAMPSPDHLHVHVLDTPDGPLLIDTGAIGSEAALAAGLDAIGVRPTRVLITHAHIDHWGLATTLTDTVLAHPGVRPSLQFATDGAGPELTNAWPGAEKMAAVFAAFTDMAGGVPAIDEIHDGQHIGDWHIHWTPGHDPGHICLFRPTDGVLLCGDLLLPGYTPNIQPGFDGADALADFLHSLQRMAALPITLVLPAHGEPYRDADARARELAAHHARRLEQLQSAMRAGVHDLRELSNRVFGADLHEPADRMLARMETYAHLDHLHRRGLAWGDADGRWTITDLPPTRS